MDIDKLCNCFDFQSFSCFQFKVFLFGVLKSSILWLGKGTEKTFAAVFSENKKKVSSFKFLIWFGTSISFVIRDQNEFSQLENKSGMLWNEINIIPQFSLLPLASFATPKKKGLNGWLWHFRHTFLCVLRGWKWKFLFDCCHSQQWQAKNKWQEGMWNELAFYSLFLTFKGDRKILEMFSRARGLNFSKLRILWPHEECWMLKWRKFTRWLKFESLKSLLFLFFPLSRNIRTLPQRVNLKLPIVPFRLI